jgi:ribonuclease P protein component
VYLRSVVYEADISAFQPAAQANTRVSRPYGHKKRPVGFGSPSPQGPQAADGLTTEFEFIVPGRYGFPRGDRFTSKREYDSVFREGRKVVGPAFVLYLLGRDEPGSKLGLAVSRKVGSAVVRNRIKRNIREFYRTHRPDLTGSIALVVVARPASALLSGAECHLALAALCRRGGVLHG